MCVCIKAFNMLFNHYNTQHYQLSLGSLDHGELLNRLVIELQMIWLHKCIIKIKFQYKVNC